MTANKDKILDDRSDAFSHINITAEERAALEAWKPLKETIDLIEQQLAKTGQALEEKRSELKPLFAEYLGLAEQKLKEMQVLLSCLELLSRYLTNVKDCYARMVESGEEDLHQ